MSKKTKFAIAALLLIIAVIIACTHGRKFYFAMMQKVELEETVYIYDTPNLQYLPSTTIMTNASAAENTR